MRETARGAAAHDRVARSFDKVAHASQEQASQEQASPEQASPEQARPEQARPEQA